MGSVAHNKISSSHFLYQMFLEDSIWFTVCQFYEENWVKIHVKEPPVFPLLDVKKVYALILGIQLIKFHIFSTAHCLLANAQSLHLIQRVLEFLIPPPQVWNYSWQQSMHTVYRGTWYIYNKWHNTSGLLLTIFITGIY